jgi:hypothetical protein
VSRWYKRFAVLGACAALAVLPAAAAPEGAPADDRVAGWADERVKGWQPTAAERRFDEIGWARDIRTARRLAEKHRRPVFLFTMDGRINIGRC